MNTIERFKSGRINIRGTIFTTLATVSKHDKTYGYHFVRVDDVYKSLNSQGFIASRENVNACIRDMKRLGQLVEIDKGSYYWGIDPVPFKAKEESSMSTTDNFDDLIGKVFNFYGVDGNFMKLDNEIWEAVEDESDGYRSLLDTVRKLPINGIFFQTPIARVRLDYVEEPGEYGDENHFYKLIDIEDNHEWLKFGTENVNDYYPCFRFEYQAKEARNS